MFLAWIDLCGISAIRKCKVPVSWLWMIAPSERADELASGCKSDWMGVRPYPATDRGIQIATWNFNKLISICKLQTFLISTYSYSYFTTTAAMVAMAAAAVEYFLFPLHAKCVSIKNGMKLRQRKKNYSKRNSITVSQHMLVNNLNIFHSLPPSIIQLKWMAIQVCGIAAAVEAKGVLISFSCWYWKERYEKAAHEWIC